jgi:hypothetical protein
LEGAVGEGLGEEAVVIEASDEVEEGLPFAFAAVGEFCLLDEVLLEGGAKHEGIKEMLTAGLVFAAVALPAIFFCKLLAEILADAVKGGEILRIKIQFVAFGGMVLVLALAQILHADIIEG